MILIMKMYDFSQSINLVITSPSRQAGMLIALSDRHHRRSKTPYSTICLIPSKLEKTFIVVNVLNQPTTNTNACAKSGKRVILPHAGENFLPGIRGSAKTI